jgi:hypothetical protein
MVRCTGACLGLARSQRPRLVLALVAPRVLAPRDLSQNASMSHYINVMHGVQRVICYMLMHNLTILTRYKPFMNLPLAFLVFNKLNTT